jgi:hypothetical protein
MIRFRKQIWVPVSWVVLALGLSVMLGCRAKHDRSNGQEPAKPSTVQGIKTINKQLNDRQALRKAVFLDSLEEMSRGRDTRSRFYLVLEEGEVNLLPEIYRGFDVRKSEDCIIESEVIEGKDYFKGLKDKKTGEPGILIEIKHLHIHGNTAAVSVGHFTGTGVHYRLRLEKILEGWVIVEKALEMISH